MGKARKQGKNATVPKAGGSGDDRTRIEEPDWAAYATLASIADVQATKEKVTYRGLPGPHDHKTKQKHIDRLEAFHGVQVAIRQKGGGYELTPDGLALATLARSVRPVMEDLHSRRAGDRPKLRVGGFATTFQATMPALLDGLGTDLDVDFVEARSQRELFDSLANCATDLAFGSSSAERPHPIDSERPDELDTLVISESQSMVAIAPAGWVEFADREMGSIADAVVNADRLIIGRADLRAVETDIPAGTPLVTCDSMPTVVSLVRRGLGVGLIWDIVGLTDERITTARFVTPIRSGTRFFAFWRKDVYEKRAGKPSDPLRRAIASLRAVYATAAGL